MSTLCGFSRTRGFSLTRRLRHELVKIALLGTCLLALPIATPSAWAARSDPLRMTVSNTQIIVENASTGRDVLLFTASLASSGGVLIETTGAKIFSDSKGDGRITYTRPTPVPLRSIWIAVDLDSGRYAIASPAHYTVNTSQLSDKLLRSDADGLSGILDARMLHAEMVIARAHAGAWRLVAADGSATDADRNHNGKLSLNFGDAVAVPGTKEAAPKRLKKDDLIFVIDPERMELFVAQVTK